MSANHSAAAVLDHIATTLAGFAAAALVSRFQSAGKTGRGGFRYWQSFYEARVKDLSAAMGAGQPRCFVSQVRWCRAAMVARGIDPEQIHDAMLVLREVIVSQQNEENNDLGAAYLDEAVADSDTAVQLPDTFLDVATSHGRLAAEFVLAVLEGRRRDACRLLTSAVDQGLSVKDAYLSVLVPAVQEIGRMWHMDEVNVAEEHFASDTAQMIIAQLQGRAEVAPANGRTLIVASVAGNRHDMGPRILANLFEMDGWRVICLGGDMPGADIAQAVVDFEADLLLLSATMPTHLRAAERSIELVRSRRDERAVRVLVGGLAFDQAPQLAEQYGADGYASSAQVALEVGRRWFEL